MADRLIPLLQAHGLGFCLGPRCVLAAIDLSLYRGSCTLISGDNGAGKSTLLHLLQGRLQPSRGWVRVLGQPLRGQRRRLCLVPQQPTLRWDYPIDVAGLVGLPCRGEQATTRKALVQTGLLAMAQAPIATLSGGQRQRALIARALTSRADVLLLDEPLSNLDHQGRRQILQLLADLGRQGTAIVFTAHEERLPGLEHITRLQLDGGRLQEFVP
jgi:ABC-type Mn2+/Zn2+ transport system ATPase subunit